MSDVITQLPAQDSSAESWDTRALAVLPGGVSRSLMAVFPQIPRIVSGNGCFLTVENGRTWIDFNNNFTSLIHGHAHQSTVDAAIVAIKGGASFGATTLTEIEYAEYLVARIGWPDQVRFCNSGTEAVMVAMRLARGVTGRSLIVLQTPAYHGGADPALISTGEALLNGVPQSVRDDIIAIPSGDTEALQNLMDSRGDEIAAILLDVMPERSGGNPLAPEFVQLARELATEHGAKLIVDEVVSLRQSVRGMAADYFKVEPDLLVVGKIIGGGFPVGAVLGRAEIMGGFDPRAAKPIFHGGTFSGNPVTMAAGHATMRSFEQADVARVNELSETFRTTLRARVQPLGLDLWGTGSLAKMVNPDPSPQSGWQMNVFRALVDRDILTTPSLRFAISTPMTLDVINDSVDRIVDGVRETVNR